MITDLNILDLDATELDAMTPDQMASYAADLWRDGSSKLERGRALSTSGRVPIVALGDSWFDYQPIGFDILDFLQRVPEYQIYDHGEAGDTLENMVYGTDFKRRTFRPSKPRLEDTLDDLRLSGAKFLLLSGGGNDFAGNELENLLNHAETGYSPIRDNHLDYLVETVFRGAFEALFERVWAIDPNIQIIGHGYGNAVPDGRAVIQIGRFQWVGPWLRPAFAKKRIVCSCQAQEIITTLISRLNGLLQSLESQYANYHALDARTVIEPSDWENELHLKNSAFRRVAMLFRDKIDELRFSAVLT